MTVHTNCYCNSQPQVNLELEMRPVWFVQTLKKKKKKIYHIVYTKLYNHNRNVTNLRIWLHHNFISMFIRRCRAYIIHIFYYSNNCILDLWNFIHFKKIIHLLYSLGIISKLHGEEKMLS